MIAKEFSAAGEIRTVSGELPEGWMGLDIGPQTAAKYEELIRAANMIVWNGPMGVFGDGTRLRPGTMRVARAVEEASAHRGEYRWRWRLREGH